MLGRCDILRPEVHLRAEDVALLLLGELVGDEGLEAVDLGERQVAADAKRLSPLVLELVVVDVAVVGRGHDDAVVLLGRLDATLDAAP